MRSAAQMVSYEIPLSLTIIPVIMVSESMNLTQIVLAQKAVWFVFPFLPCAIIFFICALAETNRTPFDLPEAEAEIVAGYNVEYSSIFFAMFFLAEYGNIMSICSFGVCLF
jgi:NADH-quinone oxidoreductase subunit H